MATSVADNEPLILRNFGEFLEARAEEGRRCGDGKGSLYSPSDKFKEYIKARVEEFRLEREKLKEREKYTKLAFYLRIDNLFLNPSTEEDDFYDRYEKEELMQIRLERFDNLFLNPSTEEDDFYDRYEKEELMQIRLERGSFFSNEEFSIKTEEPKATGDIQDMKDLNIDLLFGADD